MRPRVAQGPLDVKIVPDRRLAVLVDDGAAVNVDDVAGLVDRMMRELGVSVTLDKRIEISSSGRLTAPTLLALTRTAAQKSIEEAARLALLAGIAGE